MAKAHPLNSVTNIGNIPIDQWKDLDIVNRSEGRLFGRRFALLSHSGMSEEMVFKDILKKVQKISKTVDTAPNIESLKSFLLRLQTVESDAALTYKALPDYTLYKFRTRIHRLFDFGSHSKKIEDLITKLNKKYENLDIDELSKIPPTELSNLLQERGDRCFVRLIDNALTKRLPLDAMHYLDVISSHKKKQNSAIKIVEALFIAPADSSNSSLEDPINRVKALQVAETYIQDDQKREDVLLKLACDFIDLGYPDDSTLMQIFSMIKDYEKQRILLEKMRT